MRLQCDVLANEVELELLRAIGSCKTLKRCMDRRTSRSAPPPQITDLLDELRALEARIKTAAPATARDISALERKLGFEMPASYREFLTVLGELRVGDWHFYGVKGAAARNKTYASEFAKGKDDGGSGSYVPKRFTVLGDRGDYSNAGEGYVFDADLDAIIATDGSRWLDREDARKLDYWDWLAEVLTEERTSVAAEQQAEGHIERSTAGLTAAAGSDGNPELDRLYAAFADYEKAPRWHCYNAKCKECDASNKAFDSKPLRKLAAKHLEHYLSYALGAEGLASKAVLPRTRAARTSAFKHFLPRCLELIGEVGNQSILRERTIFARGFLTPSERKAVDAWLTHYWTVMLESDDTLPVNVTIVLRCVPKLEPYLATWDASTHPCAQRLRARCAEGVKDGDSLLAHDCLNAAGDAQRRVRDIARWLAPDWTRRIFG